MRKRIVGVVGACLLTAAGCGAAWAQTVTPRTEVWEFSNGIKVCDECTTITGSTTPGNDSVVLPSGSVGAAEISAGFIKVTYCGENAENGTIYTGPLGLTVVEEAIGSTACDALDNATEATADLVLSSVVSLAPRFMACSHDATLAAAETIAFQLRDDAASVSGVTCTSEEATTGCQVATPTAAAMAAASATAMQIVQVSNNADGDESKCVVIFAIQ